MSFARKTICFLFVVSLFGCADASRQIEAWEKVEVARTVTDAFVKKQKEIERQRTARAYSPYPQPAAPVRPEGRGPAVGDDRADSVHGRSEKRSSGYERTTGKGKRAPSAQPHDEDLLDEALSDLDDLRSKVSEMEERREEEGNGEKKDSPSQNVRSGVFPFGTDGGFVVYAPGAGDVNLTFNNASPGASVEPGRGGPREEQNSPSAMPETVTQTLVRSVSGVAEKAVDGLFRNAAVIGLGAALIEEAKRPNNYVETDNSGRVQDWSDKSDNSVHYKPKGEEAAE